MNYLNFMLEVAIETMRTYRAAMELYALSDKELNELGLTRGEILATVYLARSNINN
jgi:uncharacterized protein YjiS (DUF1127 family)